MRQDYGLLSVDVQYLHPSFVNTIHLAAISAVVQPMDLKYMWIGTCLSSTCNL